MAAWCQRRSGSVNRTDAVATADEQQRSPGLDEQGTQLVEGRSQLVGIARRRRRR